MVRTKAKDFYSAKPCPMILFRSCRLTSRRRNSLPDKKLHRLRQFCDSIPRPQSPCLAITFRSFRKLSGLLCEWLRESHTNPLRFAPNDTTRSLASIGEEKVK